MSFNVIVYSRPRVDIHYTLRQKLVKQPRCTFLASVLVPLDDVAELATKRLHAHLLVDEFLGTPPLLCQFASRGFCQLANKGLSFFDFTVIDLPANSFACSNSPTWDSIGPQQQDRTGHSHSTVDFAGMNDTNHF